MKPYPASIAQFSRNGLPYEAGDVLVQKDLAADPRTDRCAGAGGLLRREDGRDDRGRDEARRRAHRQGRPQGLRGPQREPRFGEPTEATRCSACRRRAPVASASSRCSTSSRGTTFAPRASPPRRRSTPWRRRCDAPTRIARATWATPISSRSMPIERLVFQEPTPRPFARPFARTALRPRRRPVSTGERRAPRRPISRWSTPARNAVSLTYTLEDGYGSGIVVPGAGFLLNNEMGDFNAGPGLTTADGSDRHAPEPGRPGEADALEHDPHDPLEGREGSSW